MSILQDIFSDYYEQMIYELHPRTSVVENVNKMLHCGDPSYGGAMYGCPHCGNLKFVAFSCKAISALLVVIATIKSSLFICPASLLLVFTVIVFSLSLKNFVFIS